MRSPVARGDLPISNNGNFGWRVRKGERGFHNGGDVSIPEGTSLVAPADGVVVYVLDNDVCGFGLVIEHSPTLRTGYCHLSRIDVRRRQTVREGQSIGLSGGRVGARGAGLSTAPHLHFIVYEKNRAGKWTPVDPLSHVDVMSIQPVGAPLPEEETEEPTEGSIWSRALALAERRPAAWGLPAGLSGVLVDAHGGEWGPGDVPPGTYSLVLDGREPTAPVEFPPGSAWRASGLGSLHEVSAVFGLDIGLGSSYRFVPADSPENRFSAHTEFGRHYADTIPETMNLYLANVEKSHDELMAYITANQEIERMKRKITRDLSRTPGGLARAGWERIFGPNVRDFVANLSVIESVYWHPGEEDRAEYVFFNTSEGPPVQDPTSTRTPPRWIYPDGTVGHVEATPMGWGVFHLRKKAPASSGGGSSFGQASSMVLRSGSVAEMRTISQALVGHARNVLGLDADVVGGDAVVIHGTPSFDALRDIDDRAKTFRSVHVFRSAREENPLYVFTLDPGGYEGHPDWRHLSAPREELPQAIMSRGQALSAFQPGFRDLIEKSGLTWDSQRRVFFDPRHPSGTNVPIEWAENGIEWEGNLEFHGKHGQGVGLSDQHLKLLKLLPEVEIHYGVVEATFDDLEAEVDALDALIDETFGIEPIITATLIGVGASAGLTALQMAVKSKEKRLEAYERMLSKAEGKLAMKPGKKRLVKKVARIRRKIDKLKGKLGIEDEAGEAEAETDETETASGLSFGDTGYRVDPVRGLVRSSPEPVASGDPQLAASRFRSLLGTEGRSSEAVSRWPYDLTGGARAVGLSVSDEATGDRVASAAARAEAVSVFAVRTNGRVSYVFTTRPNLVVPLSHAGGRVRAVRG